MTRLTHHHRIGPDDVRNWSQPRRDIVHESDPEVAGDGTLVFTARTGPFLEWTRAISVGAPAEDGSGRPLVDIDERIDYRLAVPFWGGIFRFALRFHLRQAPRPDGKAPWWAPPEVLTARAATILSLLCVLGAFAGYLGTLISQTLTYAAEQFGASTSDQGTLLATVRIGVLMSMVVVAFADRRGRRIVLIASVIGACAFTALGALAPGMWWLGTTQTFARSLSTVVGLVIAIIAVEEMPAGARAFAVSVLTMAAALGAGLCVTNLVYVDVATGAWRVAYAIPLLFIIPCWRIGKRLPETHRFSRQKDLADAAVALAQRTAGRALPDQTEEPSQSVNWGRFILLAASGFLWSLFLAPAAQFLNEFLRTERGFSGIGIAVFVLATNTPGGIGIVLGGKLADRHGRRIIGALGIAGGVGFTVVAYLSWGWSLWMASIVASIIGALAIPALAVYGPELFPTSQRGTANGGLQVVSVAGSSTGLLLAGWLADRIGGLGPAIAILAIGPAVLIGLILAFYPETARRELEDLNPSDRHGTDPED
jgi:MFS family permease